MDHFAALDVSVKETSICIVDDTGRITKEVKVAASLKPCRRFWGTRLQADRTGNWAAIAMAIQWAYGSRLAHGLCRDAAYAGGAEGADQQDGPQ